MAWAAHQNINRWSSKIYIHEGKKKIREKKTTQGQTRLRGSFTKTIQSWTQKKNKQKNQQEGCKHILDFIVTLK